MEGRLEHQGCEERRAPKEERVVRRTSERERRRSIAIDERQLTRNARERSRERGGAERGRQGEIR
jgi:hypothetical protein